MRAVAQRAMQMADQATGMAQRGMFFSARSELIKALQLLAQAADVQEGGADRSAALAAGLAALEEAREFTAEAGRPGEAINVAAVAARHRTPVLAAGGQASVSPIVAQQRYFAFAQEQLAVAAAGNPAASQILYRLGRMQTAIAAHDADPLALHGAKAMVFHQAALAADGGNYLAANELGVLLARYGQLADARRLLVQSVATYPHAAGWKNLAFVHRRLGEADLAQRAENELKLLQQKSPSSAAGETDMVRWVDAKTFAASPGGDIHWPDMAATSTARSVTQTRR
jgi:tetratricopeptide (TPR) repeat protein